MKKHYCVTYEVVAYVLADNEIAAIYEGADALGDADPMTTGHASEVGPDSPMEAEWSGECLVFHKDRKKDIRLDSVWPAKVTPP